MKICDFFFVFGFSFGFSSFRSYLSFHLASEHHKFYMKLRDSIISIQHISNELNIPISLGQCATKTNDIFPSDYEMSRTENLVTEPHPSHTITENNIKIIDKCTKTAGARARNLKKSMLNDNKLMRLRDKLLRRSKSTVGLSTKNPTDLTEIQAIDGNTKEEHQNKENEQPKPRCNYENVETIAQIAPKIMSPNRNRVKMGTRVFSSQFLNKSLDNIYDNAMSVYDSEADIDNKMIIKCNSNLYSNQRQMQMQLHIRSDGECMDGCTTDSSSTKKCSSDDRYLSSTTDVDRLSLKSSSLSSLHCSDKMGEHAGETSLPNTEAYVIRK